MKQKTFNFHFHTSRCRDGFARLFLFLLFPCLNALGVKAADTSGGVKFNSGVRYSQWAINSRANDFYANKTAFGLATYKVDGSPVSARKDTKNKLDYVPGLVAKGIIEAADYYQSFDWSKPWFLSVKEYGDTYYAKVPETGDSFDNLNGAKLYLGIYDNKYATDADKSNVSTALASVKKGFITANKTYIIPTETLAETAGNDVAGGWWHKSTYENQMWLDGAYMGSALLAQLTQHYGTTDNVFGSKEADWNMVFKQLNIVWNMCWNSTDKLMYHAFDATATAKAKDKSSDTWYGLSSTEPYTFHSAAYWGRADAWYLFALVDVLEAMKADGQENTENYTTLKNHLEQLAEGIAARQDTKTGGWYQLLDKDASFVSTKYNGYTKNDANYIETSATALFSAALFKAVRLNLLSNTPYDFKEVAKKAFEGLVNNFVTTDANGGIQIWGSCKSAGLSGNSYRDGSNEYYLSGDDVTMVKKGETTEGKVLGGFIMAATEYERAYQNQDSKQILFAKDLADSYDFSTTSGSLDATAYGDGTITYQWYKDRAAVANAKEATYTPTESGEYYCIATANNKSIHTSTTTVTAKASTGGEDNSTTPTTDTTIFSYTVPTTGTSSTDATTTTGGTIAYANSNTFDKDNGYKIDADFSKNNRYVKISLSENTLQAGDVINIGAYSATAGKGGLLIYTGQTNEAKSVNLGNMTAKDETLSYTVTENDILKGISTFYIYRKSGESTYFKSIKITRKEASSPIDLEASYSASSVEATVGDTSVTVPTLTVTAGETTLADDDYNVTYASSATDIVNVKNNGKTLESVAAGTAIITATIAPKDNAKYKGTTAKFTVNVKEKATEPTEDEVVYQWNTIGTTRYGDGVTEGKKAINNESIPCINFGSNYNTKMGKYMAIAPANGGFKAGDIVTISGLYTGSKSGIGMEIHTTLNDKNPHKTPYFSKDVTTDIFTVTQDCDSLYLGRYGGSTPNITALKVVRPASSTSKTKLTASFERMSDVVINTKGNITLPKLIVNAGDKVMTEGTDYQVTYKSNDENVATINDKTISINGKEGLATITATITPVNTTDYEGCTANYQITVKVPTPLNISVQDVTINTTDADVKQPEIKVYGDNDKLLKQGTDYTLSFTVSGDKNVNVDANGKFSVSGNAYAWTKGTSTITVTATPTESLGNTFTAGTLDFTYDVTEGKIKPKFLDAFNGITVKLHKDNNNREFTVPLIYDGEDVSSYFDYTYTVTGTTSPSVDGNKLTYKPSTEGTFTVTVSAKPGKSGNDDYSDVYDNPESISFTLDINSNYAVPTITLDPVSVSMYTGITEGAPDVTVTVKKDGKDEVLDKSKYTTAWTSFAPGIVKVDANSGKLEAISEGTASVRVVVRGTEGANIESTTKFFTVYVDDPALYRVKSSESFGNHTTMRNQDKTLSVTLGGWMFPNNGTPDTKILDQSVDKPEKLSNDYKWNTQPDKAKWKLTGFDYYVPGDGSKNARQENGSNAMPETTTIGSADFKTYTTKIVDPMFNVPCSGSFLVFNPKTNGKVTAHIFQNGVFDTSNQKTSYRPQRRVFIMDEAGNFVTSNARIESTNGKPTGGVYDLTKYTWDLNGGNAPTAAEVASHFDGLENFEMSSDGFKNNVYPSALSTDIMPNEAIKNHSDDKSAHGWCVLADSPVTYTFQVKAGKTYYLYNFGSKIGFYGFSFEEDANKPIVEEVTYNEAGNNTIKSTEDGHVAKVTIDRSMKAGQWTTCVLPFSLNKHQVDAIFGTTYGATRKDDGSYDYHEDGTQILYFDHVANGKAYFVRHAYNTIVANKPFLIKPTKDVESINTADVADYPYVTIEATESGEPEDWCKSNGYVWKSSYNVMDIVKDDYFIGSSDGKFKAYAGDKGTVKGFRGFLKADLNSGVKPQKLMISTYSNTGNNDGETTGIEDLIIDSDGQVKNYPTNGRVYNINGQLVSEDAGNFQSLPSGIYIINGKKYVK